MTWCALAIVVNGIALIAGYALLSRRMGAGFEAIAEALVRLEISGLAAKLRDDHDHE